jgi:alpha-beta hydrolase superfamily lysophospholipase
MPSYPLPPGVAEQARTLRCCGLEIPSAFTTPATGTPLAVLLFIPGSLFSDVNGDYPAWNSFPGASVSIAHQLAERGIAVYRYAKAGPGTGTEVTDAAEWARHRTWDGRVTIARAALAEMLAAMAEQGIDAPVFVAGHSEGAVVASRLASEHAGETAADGVVLLAGPSLGILGVMLDQNARNAPVEQRDDIMAALRVVVGHVRRGEPIPEEYKQVWGVGGLAAMPPEALQYMRDSDATDPCAALAAVGAPVLLVQGTEDANVTVRDAEALAAARAERPTSLLVLDGLSHTFKRVPAGLDAQAAFGYPGPCDERVADGVAKWIAGRRARAAER